jgi:PHD/YefM family antitoxin component YafN of YafNO toxin-antitoxin module
MRIITARQARTRFGEWLASAQVAPMGVSRRGKLVGVLVNAEDFEAMRALRAAARQANARHENPAR